MERKRNSPRQIEFRFSGTTQIRVLRYYDAFKPVELFSTRKAAPRSASRRTPISRLSGIGFRIAPLVTPCGPGGRLRQAHVRKACVFMRDRRFLAVFLLSRSPRRVLYGGPVLLRHPFPVNLHGPDRGTANFAEVGCPLGSISVFGKNGLQRVAEPPIAWLYRCWHCTPIGEMSQFDSSCSLMRQPARPANLSLVHIRSGRAASLYPLGIKPGQPHAEVVRNQKQEPQAAREEGPGVPLY